MHTIRSLFFAPANRPELVNKFPRFVADCYVIDLEDGTPPADKAGARAGLAALVNQVRTQMLPGVLTVRVNEPESDHYLDDLAAACNCDESVKGQQCRADGKAGAKADQQRVFAL